MESPKIFLAWSEKRSGQVADALSEALKSVFRGAIIPVKSSDFRAGSGWFSSLQEEMNEALGAIIIITPENTMSPWLAFETGYFMIRSAPNDRSSFVCPYLFDLTIKAFTDPGTFFPYHLLLGHEAHKKGTYKLFSDLSSTLSIFPAWKSRVT